VSRYLFHVVGNKAAQTGSPRLELADLGATRKHSAFVADLLHNAAIDSVAFQETVEVAGERGDVLLRCGLAGLLEVMAKVEIQS